MIEARLAKLGYISLAPPHWMKTMEREETIGYYVVDADIEKFFDMVNQDEQIIHQSSKLLKSEEELIKVMNKKS